MVFHEKWEYDRWSRICCKLIEWFLTLWGHTIIQHCKISGYVIENVWILLVYAWHDVFYKRNFTNFQRKCTNSRNVATLLYNNVISRKQSWVCEQLTEGCWQFNQIWWATQTKCMCVCDYFHMNVPKNIRHLTYFFNETGKCRLIVFQETAGLFDAMRIQIELDDHKNDLIRLPTKNITLWYPFRPNNRMEWILPLTIWPHKTFSTTQWLRGSKKGCHGAAQSSHPVSWTLLIKLICIAKDLTQFFV